MSLRKVELITNIDQQKDFEDLLLNNEISQVWWQKISDKKAKMEFIIVAEESEQILDKLEKKLGKDSDSRIIVSPVEALLPDPFSEKSVPEEAPSEERKIGILRISRAELMDDIKDYADANINFIAMMIFSSIVAGVGILKDNMAIVIGAMVIAPMLGPNISLAFGTVLGDIPLVKKSIRTNSIAIGMAILISFFWGLLYPGDMEEIARTEIRLSDLVIALMSGAAGALAILRNASASFVGVMVAVALLPPLIKSGLLAGEGYWLYSLYAFLIFIANTICVNVASIITFFLSGIRPKYWWEKKKAKKYTYNAFLIWMTLLIILVMIIVFLSV